MIFFFVRSIVFNVKMSRVQCCHCSKTVGKKTLEIHKKNCEAAKEADKYFMKMNFESKTSNNEHKQMSPYQKAVKDMSPAFAEKLKKNCIDGDAVFCSTCNRLYLSKRTRTRFCQDNHYYQKVCEYYYKPRGCRYRENCRNVHIKFK